MRGDHKKIIIVAHFDPGGKITRDLLALFKLLRSDNFADICLVSTGLNEFNYPEELKDIRVIIRENIGYDFYSWRHAILRSNLENYHETILFNSSFYVLNPAKFCEVLKKPLDGDIDVQGLTVSWEKAFHVQSYFFQFSRQVTHSEEFKRFWIEMTPLSKRQQVIDRYEIGFSQVLSKRFRIEPILQIGDYEKFVMMMRRFHDTSWIKNVSPIQAYDLWKKNLNPSLLFWDGLLYHFGIVKKQLVHENPFDLHVGEIQKFLRSYPL